MIRPPFLQNGDTVGITCPARKITRDEIQLAVTILESWGLKVHLGNTIEKIHHQYAGTDQERLEDVQQMLNNPEIKAIIAARGGYGTVRIMDNLNLSKLKEQPKWLVGFSDITYLHAHFNELEGIETLHGAMPIAFPKNTAEALQSLKDALLGKTLTYNIPSHGLNRNGDMEGKVLGGNLSILYSILGTQTPFNTDNCILFLEDLDEYLYHVDRMMMTLKRSGKLARLKGLIIGGMSDMKDNAIGFGKSSEEIIREHIEEYDYPVCFGFPAGHISDNRSIFLGREAHLSVGDICQFTQ